MKTIYVMINLKISLHKLFKAKEKNLKKYLL